MPALGQVLAQIDGEISPSQPKRTLGDILAQIDAEEAERPGFFKRAGLNALDRAGDIGNFLLPGDPLSFANAAESLPEAQGFGEHAADILGSAAPDLALTAATAPFAAGIAGGLGVRATSAGIAPFFAREAIHSAVLAPVEFGTRPAGEAAAITATAPIAGTAIGAGLRALGGAFGKGAGKATARELGEAAERALPPVPFRQAIQDQLPKNIPLDDGNVTSDLIEATERSIYAPDAPTGKEFNRLLRESIKQAKLAKAAEQGRALRTSDLLDAGDDAVSSAAKDAHNKLARLAGEVETQFNSDLEERVFFHGAKSAVAEASIFKEGLKPLTQIKPLGDIRGHLKVPAVFLSTDEGVARAYARGRDAIRIGVEKGTKILTQGSKEFNSIYQTIKVSPGSNLAVRRAARIVEEAQTRGFDAVEFADQTQIGTVVLNPSKFRPLGVGSSLTEEITQTGMRLPPSINEEIVEGAETLGKEAKEKFLKSLVGKGTCQV